MIIDLQTAIEKAIADVPAVNALTVYSFNRNESKFWKIIQNADGSRSSQFTGFKQPGEIPFVAYSVIHQKVTYNSKQKFVTYNTAITYLDSYDYDKNNFDAVTRRAEFILTHIYYNLVFSKCTAFSAEEYSIDYREGTQPQLVLGATMYVSLKAPFQFDPCCTPELILP